jgi:hypothetical protein
VKVPVDELTLDLEGDDEEEDRHQAVVDQVLQILLDFEEPDVDAHLGVPQLGVAVVPRRVHPHERSDRGDQEEDAASGLER